MNHLIHWIAAAGLFAAALLPSAPAESKSASRLSRTTRRAKVTSRGSIGQKSVGRLGRVIRDQSSIFSSPGTKPLYSVVPSDTYLVLVGQRDDWYAVLMADGRYGWVAKSRVELLNYDVVSGTTAGGASDFGSRIVKDAFQYLGLPYIWGGYTTAGTDCSGFVKAIFARNGVSLPRVARDQANVGQMVATSSLLPGDRLYFSFKGRYIDHTGIYIGNGYFIHNSIGNGRVAVDLLTGRRFWSKLISCRRSQSG